MVLNFEFMGCAKIADLRVQSVFLSLPKTTVLLLYCREYDNEMKDEFF